MIDNKRPLRRVVTGTDALGRSCVLHDGLAPNVIQKDKGPTFTEFWTAETLPALISGTEDGSDRPLSIGPPDEGVHLRIVQSPPEAAQAANADKGHEDFAAMNRTGISEHRTDGPHWNMHRTATVDYGFVLMGKRELILEDGAVNLGPGDVVVQLGNWHSWRNLGDSGGASMYVMMGGEYG